MINAVNLYGSPSRSTVVTCDPDNSTKWQLPRAGLCGHTALIDVGGIPNVHEPPYHASVFSIRNVAQQVQHADAYVLGI